MCWITLKALIDSFRLLPLATRSGAEIVDCSSKPLDKQARRWAKKKPHLLPLHDFVQRYDATHESPSLLGEIPTGTIFMFSIVNVFGDASGQQGMKAVSVARDVSADHFPSSLVLASVPCAHPLGLDRHKDLYRAIFYNFLRLESQIHSASGSLTTDWRKRRRKI
jgi:hypothetical protein